MSFSLLIATSEAEFCFSTIKTTNSNHCQLVILHLAGNSDALVETKITHFQNRLHEGPFAVATQDMATT